MPRKAKTIKEPPKETGPRFQPLQNLRGIKDILPSEEKYWELIRRKLKELADFYNYSRIDLPILEETNLFVRSLGKQTDIVEKEMFSFIDQGGERMTLRPEATASAARSYIQHGMMNLPQPVNLYYLGPMFRHERPQAGRLRQFYQLGFESMGSDHPVIDAQLALIAFNLLHELGIEANIQINSIGCPECREEYKKELINYLRSKRGSLCEDCKKRLVKNPLRVLDCKQEKCREIVEEAPQIVDWLCEDCKKHFVKVLEYLDQVQVPYLLNSNLVRGLDYYTRTVFEVWSEDDEAGQTALGGGGRYDRLIENLGGRPTPACGFAMGVERIIQKIKGKGIEVPEIRQADVFLAQLGEQAKRKALVLLEDLRKEEIKTAESFAKDGLRPQLETANKLKVKYTLILGQKEVTDNTILIRDMEGGVQEVVDFKKTISEIKERLGIEKP